MGLKKKQKQRISKSIIRHLTVTIKINNNYILEM